MTRFVLLWFSFANDGRSVSGHEHCIAATRLHMEQLVKRRDQSTGLSYVFISCRSDAELGPTPIILSDYFQSSYFNDRRAEKPGVKK